MKVLLAIWMLLALAHIALGRILVGGSVVSSMLSAGAHTPLHFVALAALFYAIRLLVLVALPTAMVFLVGHALVRMGFRSVAALATA